MENRVFLYLVLVLVNMLSALGIMVAFKNIDLMINMEFLEAHYDVNALNISIDMITYYQVSVLILYGIVTWLVIISLILLVELLKDMR